MLDSLLISLKLSILTTFTLIILCLFLCFLLYFYHFPFKQILIAMFLLPILLPPTVLGFYLLYIFSPSSPVGGLYKHITNKTLSFSFEGLLLASLIYSMPLAFFPLWEAVKNINVRWIEIAYVFGYSKIETFFKVILPNIKGYIISASALVFAHTMGEFGVVLMVGGDIPGKTRTISIYIYDAVQSLDYKEAHKASIVLILFSLISLSILLIGGKRIWKEENYYT